MRYQNIPTNLITGFLGVGKTTAIRHLLTQVPQGERWGVLVNEFGEIGIDGTLLEADGIAVQEVAGGCLCCVAAGGLEVGLNQLIKRLNPDRILIEPSGLGHPAQILDKLASPPFNQVVALQATIGLVDARHLSQPRYRTHPTFQDQIHLSDVLVASKVDLYDEKAYQEFEQFVYTLTPPKQHLATVERGKLDKAWLTFSRLERQALFPEAHQFLLKNHSHDHESPSEHSHHPQHHWLKVESAKDEYHSCGWLIDKDRLFNRSRTLELLKGLSADRVKGVLNTEDGWLAINLTPDEREIRIIGSRENNRLEIIHHQVLDWQAIDQALMNL